MRMAWLWIDADLPWWATLRLHGVSWTSEARWSAELTPSSAKLTSRIGNRAGKARWIEGRRGRGCGNFIVAKSGGIDRARERAPHADALPTQDTQSRIPAPWAGHYATHGRSIVCV